MHTIYKYPLLMADHQTVALPRGARLLTVQTQGGDPMLWALVDPSAPPVMRYLHTYGTGHPMNAPDALYVGTYQMDSGALVFHVFAAPVGEG